MNDFINSHLLLELALYLLAIPMAAVVIMFFWPMPGDLDD